LDVERLCIVSYIAVYCIALLKGIGARVPRSKSPRSQEYLSEEYNIWGYNCMYNGWYLSKIMMIKDERVKTMIKRHTNAEA
jgi:hypothetical protein